MKYIFYILLSIASFKGYAQKDPSLALFTKSLERYIGIPHNAYEDSCYYTSSLLKIRVDNQYKVVEISVSDNAEDWLVEELKKLRANKYIDTASLEKYAKKTGIRNSSFVIPIIIGAEWGRCNFRSIGWYGIKYYQFKGKALTGNCIFLDPIELFLAQWQS